MDPVLVLAFLPAALALNLTPGADMVFCLGQGRRGGRAAALAASAGISLGVMVHVAAAGLGLGAVMAAAPGLFDAIRWAGVGYLLWLAVVTLRAGHPASGAGPALTPRRAFAQALLVNLGNPKVILFVLALLPQFVDPAGPVLLQFLSLGAVLAAGGFAVNGAVGLCAGGIGRRLAGSRRIARWLARASAGIFAALALRLIFLERE